MCTRDMSVDSLQSSMDSLATHEAPSTSAQVSAPAGAEHESELPNRDFSVANASLNDRMRLVPCAVRIPILHC